MRKAASILLCVLVLSLTLWWVCTFQFVSWDFRSNLWADAYLLWHREPVYDIPRLFPGSSALWLPQVITLFAPLGLLPVYPATNIWLALNIILLVFLTWHLARQAAKKKPGPLFFFILILGVTLFPPTGGHLILGQVDILLIAAVMTGTWAVEKGRILLAGFLFAVALVKPQLCILVLPCILVWLSFIKRRGRQALTLTLVAGLTCLVLAVPLWISNPAWVEHLAANFHTNPYYIQPSVFSLLPIKLGFPGLAVWVALLVITLLFALRLWLRCEPRCAVLWSLALTTVVCPYIWGWDFVLLLPLLIDTAARLVHPYARAVLLASFILCLALTVLSIQSVNSGDYMLWWMPYEMLVGAIAALEIERKLGKNFPGWTGGEPGVT